MRRLFGWITGLVGVAALAASAGAQAPAGSDGWDLRRTPESCFLFRSFATVAGKMDVRIQSFGPTTPYQVILHGPGLPLRDNDADMGMIAFGDEVDAALTLVFIGKANNVPMVVIPASPPRPGPLNTMGVWFHGGGPAPRGRAPIDPAAERLFVDFPDGAPLTLELGPMVGEYTRLDACAQELVAQWTRAASQGANPASGPQMLDDQGMISRIWFPPNLSMNRISGMVQLRMTVNTNGRARDCVVQAWTGASQFGEEACDKMERWARFEPGRDAQGNAVSALYRTAVMFIIYKW